MRQNRLSIAMLLGSVFLVFAAGSNAQINKEHVEKAPKEDPAPWPHIDPDDPLRFGISGAASGTPPAAP